MIEFLIQSLELNYKYMEKTIEFFTLSDLKTTDKRRGERVLLLSNIAVMVACSSLKSVRFPPNVCTPTYSIELNRLSHSNNYSYQQISYLYAS